MRINVVADDEVGLLAFVCQALAQRGAEELMQHWDAMGFRCRGRAGGRLDPEAGYAGGNKVLEQVAIISRDLDNEAVGIEPQALTDHLRVAGGMRQPCR